MFLNFCSLSNFSFQNPLLGLPAGNSDPPSEISAAPCRVLFPPLDKGFFPIPGATAHPSPAHPEDSVAWEAQLPADQKHRCFPESLWFPCPSAKREQRSRPLIPSQLPGRICSLASSLQTAPEFPALLRNCRPELSAGCKREESPEDRSQSSGFPLCCKYHWYISYLWFIFREINRPPLSACVQSS